MLSIRFHAEDHFFLTGIENQLIVIGMQNGLFIAHERQLYRLALLRRKGNHRMHKDACCVVF